MNVETTKDSSLDLITRHQVVQMLNISQSTLDRWSKEKLINRYKLGRKVFYKKSDLISFIENNKI